MSGFLILLVLLFLYLIPAIVAHKRLTANRWAVTVIDVFLGWTLIGWVASLAMAVGGSKSASLVEDEALARGTRTWCPYCAEVIKPDAIVCRYCGRDVSQSKSQRSQGTSTSRLDNLLDRAEEAATRQDWAAVRRHAARALLIDPNNTEALGYREEATQALQL